MEMGSRSMEDNRKLPKLSWMATCWWTCFAMGTVLLVGVGGAGDGTTTTATLERTPTNDIQISPSRVALLHMVDDIWFFQEMANVTLENKRRYARRHGYEMVVHNPYRTSGLLKPIDCAEVTEDVHYQKRGDKCYVEDTDFKLDDRAPTFGKIKLALHACVGRSGYWLLWSDADALIVNQSVPLTSIVNDRYDIMLTEDWLMINAGILLIRCSPWTVKFLKKIYADRSFDKALALDQSAIQHYLDGTDDAGGEHVKLIPKHVLNVYTEEYRPGDFLLHMAGKLYEATVDGAVALTRQFDLLSRQEDPKSVRAFFETRGLLNAYAGHCRVRREEYQHLNRCSGDDPRRALLDAPLGAMSSPNRYRHAGIRQPRLRNWKDVRDVTGWNE